jgi:hypothetical protein
MFRVFTSKKNYKFIYLVYKMLSNVSNVGHTIQKMINNTPVAITANDTTTEVVTNGGNVYQSGLMGGKIQFSFREVITNENLVGRVVDVQATEDKIYILNAAGSVFEYDFTANSCGPLVREVYSPAACGAGDKAIKITSGRAHVLILTENNKIWGAGSNDQYQLVPQGQCKYDTAVEIVVTDTNLHDNDCCNAFTGIFNELLCPVIPTCETKCNEISCVKDTKCDILLGYLNICQVVVTPPGQCGILSVPVYGDISYVGFLCIDKNGCASGSLTYTITRLFIKCGCFISKFTTNDNCGCHIKEFNTSSTIEILIFEANQCPPPKTDTCAFVGASPITGTAQIQGKCGSCVIVNIDLPHGLPLPGAAFDFDCKTILLELKGCRTSLTALCDSSFCGLSCEHNIDLDLDFDVPLDCCEPFRPPKPPVELPQPCWSNIFAGQDTSVLVDNCNRIYVFGSIHNVRSNKDLLKGSCLEELLNRTNASISFPADQLNCAGNRVIRNENCKCPKCRDKSFKTDLTKFGIHLSFPNGDECDQKNMNVCDFLSKLKHCNEIQNCEPTCEPCDAYIYLNVSGECGCPCGAPVSSPIGSVTLFNKRSICKLVSQGCPDLACVPADIATIVEFDLNKYCIDTTDVSLDKIVKLDFCVEGPNVNVYIDLDKPGGIKFTSDGKKCNVDFTVNASTQTHQFILNFGSILDPVELTNLKFALSLDCFFPCPRFKNPFDTKLTNTYLKGGDHVKFVVSNPKNIRQAVTADVPTVFRLNRRILDVAIGFNNLTVLVGGLACPNELFAIGFNCRGELGIGTNESIVCWRQLNRCQFDCQVNKVFAGKFVTFYETQTNHIYAAGQWKCFVNSTSPVLVKSICQSWKIKQMAITNSHIVLLGSDGCIFGLGDNSVGELGLCHLDCVSKPTPLVFFYKLNSCVAKQLRDNLDHPIESKNKKRFPPCRPNPCGNFGNNNFGNNNFGNNNCGNFGNGGCGNFGNGGCGNFNNNFFGQGCNVCKVDPCECNLVKYYKYPRNGSSKKYMPNNRLFNSKNGKY